MYRSSRKERELKLISIGTLCIIRVIAPYAGSENWNCLMRIKTNLLARSLPTQGTRIEIVVRLHISTIAPYRSPHRERELKSNWKRSFRCQWSTLLPTQRERIEMGDKIQFTVKIKSLPRQGVRIEICDYLWCKYHDTHRSPHRERELKSAGTPAAGTPWYRSPSRERELK